MQPIEADYGPLTATEAVQVQRELLSRIRLVPFTGAVRLVGGADISFNKFSDVVYAGIVLLEYPSLTVVHREAAVTKVTFPYMPGLLAFRELPPLIEVWNKLPQLPDVLVLDGQGTAHPRRMGIATHFGILAGVPTIGCGKTLLVGRYGPLGEEQFATADLMYQGEQIGEVLRTKARTNPVFVSPGNLITQEQSTELMKRCTGKYRIPEPTRQAHLWVNEVRLKARAERDGRASPGVEELPAG